LFLLGYECGYVEFLALLHNGINVADTLTLHHGDPVSALKSNSSILLVCLFGFGFGFGFSFRFGFFRFVFWLLVLGRENFISDLTLRWAANLA
jgi:hypothetical protein